MKKLISLVLVCLFLFTGCASLVQEDANPTKYEKNLQENLQVVDLTPNIEKHPALYFLNSDSSTLVAETRNIPIEQNTRPEIQVIEELLKGPTDQSLRSVAEGFKLDSVETMYNVVNVNLTTTQNKSDEQIFNLSLAITNTLCEFLSTNYINVYVNGKTAGYYGNPVGALSKNQGILADEKAKQSQRSNSAEISTVLYFLDNSEQYLVPEVRSIQYSGSDYVSKIIDELAKGPEEMYYYRQSVDSSIKVVGNPVVETDAAGINTLVIDLNKTPVVFTEGFEDGETLAIASIVYTVIGFVPGVDRIRFTVNGTAINDKTYSKKDFSNTIGASIRLYLPNADATMLMPVDRTVSQDIAPFPSTILDELINGPSEKDSSGIWPAFPDGVTKKDVNKVYIASDMVVVDFNKSILDKIKDMTEEDEMLMIYSIINSLTYLPDIRLVQFLIDGEREQAFSKTIDIRDPMMKNPGIIKY